MEFLTQAACRLTPSLISFPRYFFQSLQQTSVKVRAGFHTVNLDIFARVLFLRNLAYASFVKIKSLLNGQIILSLTNEG